MLRIKGLTVGYGGKPVLEGVDLHVAAGTFASLVGPSGSGKTSILRVAAGLLRPEHGTVDLALPRTDVGFLFQDDVLLPWRTARQNVALGLRIRGMPTGAAGEAADRWLTRLGLAAFGDRYPGRLSGGQRKRVAIAQVLALAPKLLLMDEPFASLDAIVRMRITQELLDWVERERMTVLLVTHDLEEAISLSDVVYVLSQGPYAGIKARYDVAIERPRRVLESRRHPAFGPLLQRVWSDLADEPGDRDGGRAAMMPGRVNSRAVRRVVAAGLLLAVWETLSRAGWLDPFYAPPPSAVAAVLASVFADGSIWPHLEATLVAAASGLAGGLAAGVALGFAAALVPVLAELLEPLMILLNAIPRVILAPLLVIWLGIGLASKVALALILVTVLLFFAVYSGIREVDQRLVERVRTLGGGRRVLIRDVYVPSTAAWVMGSLKIAVGFAFTGSVVGEFVASSRGLGYLLQFAQSTYNAALTIALIVLIMAVVLVLFAMAEWLERRLLRWRYE